MSNAADKQIKFTFAVDQRSLEVAKSAIRQLTSEVKTLVETMSRAGSGMQGLGGGLLGGFSGKSGGVNPQQQSTVKGGSALTQGIAADAKALSAVAKAGTDAIRNMTSGVKTSLTDQISNLERLKKTVQDLERAYDRLGNVQAPSGSRAGRNLDGMRLEQELALGAARQQLASASAGMPSPGGGQGFVGAGQRVVTRGGVDYVENGAPAPGGGVGNFWKSVKGVGGGIMSRLGIPAWAGAGGAALGLYEAGTVKYLRNDMFQAQEGATALSDSLRRRAGISQAYGGMAMGARRDLNMGLAVGGLTPTEIRSALGPEAYNALMTKAYQETGNTPRLGDIKDKLMSGNASYSFKGGLESQESRAKLERALGNINAEQAQALAAAAQQKLQAQSVRETTYLGEFQGNHLGRMALMRQARLGGEHNTPLFSGNKAQLLGYGTAYTSEEVAGTRASLAQSAGGGHMGAATSVLGYQYGGLGNAAGLYGAAAGYGNPAAFMSAVSRGSSMYGAPGLVDVAATGSLGDLYTGAMMGGDFNTSGVAGMQGIMSATASLGGGLRAGRAVAGGYQALSAYSAGQTDPLQRAVNVLASVQAAGGAGLYTQEALRNMSPAQRMDLMRQIDAGTLTDANLPEELKLQGVTTSMLRQYGQSRDKYMFAEYMSSQASSSKVTEAVGAWRSQGAGSLKGLKGAGLFQRLTELGVAARQSGRAGSVEEGRGMVAALAAGEGIDVFKALGGGGVGDVAGRSMEAELKRNQDYTQVLDRESFYAKKDTKEKIRTGSSYETSQLATHLDALSTTVGIEGKKVGDELRNLAADIYEARVAIRQNRPARARASAPGEKK